MSAVDFNAEAQRRREVKPSGIAWLGDVPEGWKSRKIKYTFLERNQKNFPYEPLLAATQNHGVILKSEYENRTVEATKALDTLKLVEVGDFVISLRSFQGGLELSYRRGIISPAYTILIPTHVERCYFKYLAKSPSFISLLKSKVTGIREGQNIDYNKLRDELMPIPPVEEQRRMGTYLDEATGRIDKAIEAEEKMVALLQERREIVINEAVSPRAGWETRRFGWLMHEKTPISAPNEELLSVYLYRGVIRFSEESEKRTNATSSDLSNYQFVEPGDFVMNNQQAWRGSVGVSPYRGIVSPAYFVMVLSDRLVPQYANYLLRSPVAVNLYEKCSKGIGTIQRNLDWSMLKIQRLAFPCRSEQEAIVKRLDEETGKIDRAIAVKRRQIELLRERREITINEVVTGKVKVA